ncbi:MAG: endolytic transglycosylase MltG [Bacteroidetes bacterium]|nr:endolytic transglycosylase MltG [Bacteroidota bacterium]
MTTIASIVQEETHMATDKPIIAGVYINRIKKGIPLEADPTLKFALKNFEIRRVLNADKLVESPYNTYKYAGIPPGPICIPDISTIDAVLNYSRHDYIFFCAKEDLSGYSNFAITNSEHEANARRYQQALDKMNIKR